jgi:hypothetical protein
MNESRGLAARDQDRAKELVHRFQDIVARAVGAREVGSSSGPSALAPD